MSVVEWFVAFDNELKIKNAGSISTRFKAIARQFNADFWSEGPDAVLDADAESAHCFYVGSVGRGTAISPLKNLNMIVEMPIGTRDQYDEFDGNGHAELLYAVKNSMKKVYETAIIGEEGRVPFVKFRDGISFEVMPVLHHSERSYLYPDPENGGKWRTMMPIVENLAIRERNAACKGNLFPLCRMAKAWADKWNLQISSLLLDTLAYQFIDQFEKKNEGPEMHAEMCCAFFQWLAGTDKTKISWRVPGSNQEVFREVGFYMQARQTYDKAKEALALSNATPSRDFNAKQKWREVFGNRFPI